MIIIEVDTAAMQNIMDKLPTPEEMEEQMHKILDDIAKNMNEYKRYQVFESNLEGFESNVFDTRKNETVVICKRKEIADGIAAMFNAINK